MPKTANSRPISEIHDEALALAERAGLGRTYVGQLSELLNEAYLRGYENGQVVFAGMCPTCARYNCGTQH